MKSTRYMHVHMYVCMFVCTKSPESVCKSHDGIADELKLGLELEPILWNHFGRNLRIKPDLVKFKFVIIMYPIWPNNTLKSNTQINLHMWFLGEQLFQNLRKFIQKSFRPKGSFVKSIPGYFLWWVVRRLYRCDGSLGCGGYSGHQDTGIWSGPPRILRKIRVYFIYFIKK
jgi:hypothetical protein